MKILRLPRKKTALIIYFLIITLINLSSADIINILTQKTGPWYPVQKDINSVIKIVHLCCTLFSAYILFVAYTLLKSKNYVRNFFIANLLLFPSKSILIGLALGSIWYLIAIKIVIDLIVNGFILLFYKKRESIFKTKMSYC